jgi:hypothetical protein
VAIAHRASTTVEGATTVAITNNVPAGTTNGDLLLWRISDTTTTVPATPSGWTLLISGTATATMVVIWWRIAASEPASYTTAAFATAGRRIGIMSCYSGVDNTTPFDVTTPAMVAGTTAVACPAITPTTSGAWVLGIANATVALNVTTTTFSSANTTIDTQKTTTSTTATNDVGAHSHFAWSSGAFTPTFTASQTMVRTLGGSVALRAAAAAATPVHHPTLPVNRAALIRASSF